MPSTFAQILDELSDPFAHDAEGNRHDHGVWALADAAGCSTPDGIDSPGADFLARVARDVAESVTDQTGRTDARDAVQRLVEDDAHEIADSAVPISTHERWATFTDLGAYNEDVTELIEDVSDLTQTETAGVALYMIADRLVQALAQELSDALDADEGEELAPGTADADYPWTVTTDNA